MPQRRDIFISYSHADKSWLDRLCVHLRPLEKRHRLAVWSDSRIEPGGRWQSEIVAALASTRVAVLLVSADFLSSEFIADNELPPLLEAAEKEGTAILPLIVSPCSFHRHESLRQFQPVNPAEPLLKLSKVRREAMLTRLTEEIERLLTQAPQAAPAPAPQVAPRKGPPGPPPAEARQFNPKYRFETFVVGVSNELAHAAARAVAEAPCRSYNPLFVYGGVGVGKTHLLHAIGSAIEAQHPHLRVLYLAAEQFVNELINFIRTDRMPAFRERYRTVDVLLLDDVQFLANKERTQEEFFHTFNTLYTAQKQIILSSDSSPRNIPTLEERLRSRFEWGLLADIQAPDHETKMAIIRRKAELEGIPLPEDFVELIANLVRSNVRELEGLVNRVVAFSSLTGRPVTRDLGVETLKDILPEPGRKPAAAEIIKAVARHYDLKVSELKSKSNARAIVWPRQVAMYLCKRLTDLSYPDIGKQFNDKHHSTVMFAVAKVQAVRDSDVDFDRVLRSFEEQFSQA